MLFDNVYADFNVSLSVKCTLVSSLSEIESKSIALIITLASLLAVKVRVAVSLSEFPPYKSTSYDTPKSELSVISLALLLSIDWLRKSILPPFSSLLKSP